MKVRVMLALVLIPFLLFYGLPAGAAEKEERKWQDETIYFMMVDRFNNEDPSNDFNVNTNDPKAYHGGDFKGIIEKLDYLKEMGFTAIWLTPIFDNEEGGYHGYWINDFYKTEEHFGTIDDFKQLVKEAHKRDIKIILDFVVNHVGPNHPWATDPSKRDWFHEKQDIVNWNDQKELENNWLYGLPDFNQDNPETRAYLLDAAKWWINETDIDGYRLDTVRHVPTSFWDEFSKEVKAEKENFYLLGEVWSNDPAYIAKYDKAGIDGFVDFLLQEQLRTAFAKPDESLDWVFTAQERNRKIYEDPYLMGTFIDNHDVVRFTRDILLAKQEPETQWKLALTYMYTTPGIPIVYYGSEIALDGTDDPDNRRQMEFGRSGLDKFIGQLGKLRQEHPSLTRGTMEKLYERDGMAVYKRAYKDEQTLIAINNTSKKQTVTITNEQLDADKELRGMLAGNQVKGNNDGYAITLGKGKSEIYRLADKSGPGLAAYLAIAAGVMGLGILLFTVFKIRRKKAKL